TSYSVILSVHSFPSIHFPLFFLLLSPFSVIISSQAILILFSSWPNSFSSGFLFDLILLGYCWLEKKWNNNYISTKTTYLTR
ncbi:hypothetical protein KSS87_013909, partial [Heliosperma pusillum]